VYAAVSSDGIMKSTDGVAARLSPAQQHHRRHRCPTSAAARRFVHTSADVCGFGDRLVMESI